MCYIQLIEEDFLDVVKLAISSVIRNILFDGYYVRNFYIEMKMNWRDVHLHI